MNLLDLKPNEKVLAEHCEQIDLPLKLMEMGCIDGVEITFIGKAPLGSPYYYKIGDSRIALGKEIAALIKVKPLNQYEKK